MIGDGAMSAGMAFEALNNAGIAGADLLVILNDNEMSISEPVGALNGYLAKLLASRFYNSVRRGGKEVLSKLPPVKELAMRLEEHMKGMVLPGTLFEEFGFNYIGPIDGHDVDVLVTTLANVKALQGPQLLHVITKKGYGYARAEEAPILYHGVTPFDPAVGYRAEGGRRNRPTPASSATGSATWRRRTRASSRSRRRCAKAPGSCASRRSIPTATSTSASPSSMR